MRSSHWRSSRSEPSGIRGPAPPVAERRRRRRKSGHPGYAALTDPGLERLAQRGRQIALKASRPRRRYD